jgi:hypothetical protein
MDVELVASVSSTVPLAGSGGPSVDEGREYVMIDPYTGAFVVVKRALQSVSGCAEQYVDGDPPQRQQLPVEIRGDEDSRTVTVVSNGESPRWRRLVAEFPVTDRNTNAVSQMTADYRATDEQQWQTVVRPVVVIPQSMKDFLRRVTALLGAANHSIETVEQK